MWYNPSEVYLSIKLCFNLSLEASLSPILALFREMKSTLWINRFFVAIGCAPGSYFEEKLATFGIGIFPERKLLNISYLKGLGLLLTVAFGYLINDKLFSGLRTDILNDV